MVNIPKLPKSLQLHSCYQLMGINLYHANAIFRPRAYSSPRADSGKYGTLNRTNKRYWLYATVIL